MPDFARINLEQYPEAMQALAEGQTLLIGDLHGNALKLIWTLVHSEVMSVGEEAYAELVAIYKTPAAQLTAWQLDRFNQIISEAEISLRALVLIGDELCDRGQNDYFTLQILNKLKQSGMPVEIMVSNHGIEFLIQYREGTLKTPRTNIGSSDNSIRGLATLLKKQLVSEEEIRYLVENAYKPCLRLLSYSQRDETQFTLYTHAPVGLETLKALTGNQEMGAANFKACCDAINAQFHADFDTRIETIAAQMQALGITGLNSVSADTPELRLIWNRVTNLGDVGELVVPEWLEVVHGHVGSVRQVCKGLSNINLAHQSDEGFEPLAIDTTNPLISYHPRMKNLDNDLGKRALVGAYHYEVGVGQQATFTQNPIEGLEEVTDSSVMRFSRCLLKMLSQGNALLFEHHQATWGKINSNGDRKEVFKQAFNQNDLSTEQVCLMKAILEKKQGSLKDILADFLNERFPEPEAPEPYVKPFSLELSETIEASLQSQEQQARRGLLFRASIRHSCLHDVFNQLDELALEEAQKSRLLGFITTSILSEQGSTEEIKSAIAKVRACFLSLDDADNHLGAALLQVCNDITQMNNAIDEFRHYSFSQERASKVIAQLHQMASQEYVPRYVVSYLARLCSVFGDESRGKPLALVEKYLEAGDLTLDYARCEVRHFSAGLDAGRKVFAEHLMRAVDEYCMQHAIEGSRPVDYYRYFKTIFTGGIKLSNLPTEISEGLDVSERLKRILNREIRLSLNQQAISRKKLERLTDKIFRVDRENNQTIDSNPYALSFFSGSTKSYAYSQGGQIQSVSLKITATMKTMMAWVEKANHGEVTMAQARFEIARLGKKACARHGIAEGDDSAKAQVYLLASKLTDDEGLRLQEDQCKAYCEALGEKISSAQWDIRFPAGTVIKGNRISNTMNAMRGMIAQAQEGEMSWKSAYKAIRAEAIAAKIRHANAGKQESRVQGKTAPFSFYAEIAKSNVLTISQSEAAIILTAIKADMDTLIERGDHQKKICGFVIGGTAVTVYDAQGGQSKLVLADNLAKMYTLYQRYQTNPEAACNVLDEIMKCAHRASSNNHRLRRSELHAFYKKVATEEHAEAAGLEPHLT